MKDFLGNEVTIGDIAAYQATVGNGGRLVLVKVVGLTAKQVRIARSSGYASTSNVSSAKLIVVPHNKVLKTLSLQEVRKLQDTGLLGKLGELMEDEAYRDYPAEWILATLQG